MSTLYAIPTPLGGKATGALPDSTRDIVRSLRDFAAEDAKSARAFLKDLGMPVPLQELHVSEDLLSFMKILESGKSVGLLSEAGCPAVADPGAALVDAAQRAGIRVVPLIGPSSILLALMASGLEGQRFSFCGYLPREPEARKKRIKALESRSKREDETQIFIETPYRNDAMLAALLEQCSADTRLCIASDLTLDTESVRTQSVREWRAGSPSIGKRPTVFLLLSK